MIGTRWQQNDTAALIDNHIRVWRATPAFAPLAEILLRDRDILTERLPAIFKDERPGNRCAADAVRSFLLVYALELASSGIDPGHFVLFREEETVQIILEDSFGVEPGGDWDVIVVPHQELAIRVLVKCLFGKRVKSEHSRDVTAFMQLFSRNGPTDKSDQDRVMRYKSMVWLVYLAIALISVERITGTRGLESFSGKFRELLERALAGDLINEDSREPGFEDGKWEDTLFGWLQGEDRKEFLLKLKRQFNLDNRLEHANRRLLAEHRKCVFEQVMALLG